MIYVGTMVRIAVALPGGRLVEVRGAPTGFRIDVRALKPGDPVSLGYPVEAALLFDRP
jgi:hypothetical protein